MVEQWNSDGGTAWWNDGTLMVEQCWWNSGTMMVEEWNSVGGTVMVEQCWWNSETVIVEQCGGIVEQ